MKKSSADLVLEAAQELHSLGELVTKRSLQARLPALRGTVIDDRLGHLVDEGRLYRAERGVFVPAEQHPPARLVSRTLLPDGCTVLEVGDSKLVLTPRESRMVGEAMAGSAQQYAGTRLGLQVEQLAGALTHKVLGLAAQLEQLQDNRTPEASDA